MDPVNAGGFVTPQWLAYSEVIVPAELQEQLAGTAAICRNSRRGLQDCSSLAGPVPCGKLLADKRLWQQYR
jgi:hypothetical protein